MGMTGLDWWLVNPNVIWSIWKIWFQGRRIFLFLALTNNHLKMDD